MSTTMQTKITVDEYKNITSKMKFCQDNPHLCQCIGCPIRETEFQLEDGMLTDKNPETPYERRRKYYKSVLHWGQRKLLLGELLFLTKYAKPGMTVLYIGSAPETHLKLFFEIFPRLKWVLVDPSPFNVRPSKSVRIINKLFTTKMCERYVEKADKLLLISDNRRDIQKEVRKGGKPGSTTMNRIVDDKVKDDMQLQREWVEIIGPVASHLKFRLPYLEKDTTYNYLDGTVFFQAFPGPTSTETRLVVEGRGQPREWDANKYNDQLFHHNTITRVTHYPHNVEAPGLDHCFDCAFEVFIIRQYLEKYEKENNTDKRVGEFVKWISKIIGNSEEALKLKTKISLEKYEDISKMGQFEAENDED